MGRKKAKVKIMPDMGSPTAIAPVAPRTQNRYCFFLLWNYNGEGRKQLTQQSKGNLFGSQDIPYPIQFSAGINCQEKPQKKSHNSRLVIAGNNGC